MHAYHNCVRRKYTNGSITLGARGKTMPNVAPGSARLPIFMTHTRIAKTELCQFVYNLADNEFYNAIVSS